MNAVDFIWSDTLLDEEDIRAERAWQKGQLDAIGKARQFGTRFCVVRDEKLVALSDTELTDLEQKGFANLERLDRQIAEFQDQSTAALVLNDAPVQPIGAKQR
ncbi:MAG: hypothetical protein JWO95_2386 [Verrucomicrobiales bacterium]|nr:hypothetical protein [Verrucomicrobiales bacterium]